MLLSATHHKITLVPTEYKARQPQGQSGQFGKEKILSSAGIQIPDHRDCGLFIILTMLPWLLYVLKLQQLWTACTEDKLHPV
jgi:hypothetical protein